MTTNPLQLLPAKARATVYIIALIIGVSTPILIPALDGIPRLTLTVLAAIAALFATSQGLANLTPDTKNQAIQTAKHPTGEDAPPGDIKTNPGPSSD